MPPARGRRGRGARGKQVTTRTTRSTQPVSSTPPKDLSSEVEKEADESNETGSRQDETAESIEDVEMQVSRDENEADQETASVAEGDNTRTTQETDDSQNQERMEESREDGDTTRDDNSDQTSALDVDQSVCTTTSAELMDEADVEVSEHNATDDVIIIDDDDKEVAQPAEKEAEKEISSAPLWRVRVCPVLFKKFCQMDHLLKKMTSLCVSLEFRMSSLLLHPKVKKADLEFQQGSNIPWQPESNMTRAEANSMGMLEMKVVDASLVELIHTVRSARLSQRSSVRFELKRLSKKEALLTEWRKDMGQLDDTQVGGDVQKQTEDSTSQDTCTVEELLVNFALRPGNSSAGEDFIHTDAENSKEEKDSYLYVKKVPDVVPDNVLKAVFLTNMVERQKREDSNGTATFDAGSSQKADKCLRLYRGVLINLEVLELSTAREKLEDLEDNESGDFMDVQELWKANSIAQEMLEICKVEILKALPKSAIPDTYAASKESQAAQESVAQKAELEEGKTKPPESEKMDTAKKEERDNSEREKAETSNKKKTGISEEANIGASDKKKEETWEQEITETSQQKASGTEKKTEQQRTPAKKSGIRLPQSLKVKEATKAINSCLLRQKLKNSSSQLVVPHTVLPEGMGFRHHCDLTPYCDVATQVSRELPVGKEVVAGAQRPALMSWKLLRNFESKARDCISLASFQDLAVSALTEILKKDVLSVEDVTALKRIVDGLHQSTLVMGASGLMSVANLRLLRRDAYFKQWTGSEAKRLSLRASPFEHAQLFAGSEEEVESGKKSAEKASSKDGESEPKAPAESTESSQAVPTLPQNDSQKVEDKTDETHSEGRASKAENKGEKEDSAYRTAMEQCRAEIARVLHALAVTPESETLEKGDASEDQSAPSQDLKSHEILQIVKVINSFLSGPSFTSSSFVLTEILPLQFRFWGSLYATVQSFFDVKPPKQDFIGMNFNTPVALQKRLSIQLERSTRSLTALACFMERAAYALKVILSKAEITKADVETLRCIVKGASLQTPLSIGEAVFIAACFQISWRSNCARRLNTVPESVKIELLKGPVGTGSLFGPRFSSICKKYNTQLNVPSRHERERLRRPVPPRPGRAGAAAKRLQGAYRGVPGGGKLLNQPSRGATRARPSGGKFDTRRGGHPGQSRGGRPAMSGRGRNMSRQRLENVDWRVSSQRGRPQSLLGEIPRGLGPVGPGHSIRTVHANLQAQVQAAQRELMLLEEQAMRTQAQLLRERELLSNYNQGAYRQVRPGPYQGEGRQDRYRQQGRSNRPRVQHHYQKQWARKKGR